MRAMFNLFLIRGLSKDACQRRWPEPGPSAATWDRRAVLEDEAAQFRATGRAVLGGRDDPQPYRGRLGARV
jgi:hypothetical protein